MNVPAKLRHEAVLTPARPRKVERLDVAVRCSCGMRMLVHVYKCDKGKACPAGTHIKHGATWLDEKVAARFEGPCPAVAFVVRLCDPAFSRDEVERFVISGELPT